MPHRDYVNHDSITVTIIPQQTDNLTLFILCVTVPFFFQLVGALKC